MQKHHLYMFFMSWGFYITFAHVLQELKFSLQIKGKWK